jgi:hypothetical protein
MRSYAVSRAALVGLALLVLACGSTLSFSPLLERQRLALASERWRDATPADYSFTMQRVCFCMDDGEMRVRVEDGVVVSVRPVGSDIEVVGPARTWYPAMPALFDIVHDAIDRPAFSILAEYDQTFGFPSNVFIDYMQNAADEEYGFRIRDVTFP